MLKQISSQRMPLTVFCVTAGSLLFLWGCGGGGRVESLQTIESNTMDQTTLKWKRSSIFEGPIFVRGDDLWNLIQNYMGKKLPEVDFQNNMVVGGFAVEPDMPEKKADGTLKDRGFGVNIDSIRKDSDGAPVVRMDIKTARYPQQAKGPLHFAFAVIPQNPETPTFYINGKKFQVVEQPAFIRKTPGMTKQLLDTYVKEKE